MPKEKEGFWELMQDILSFTKGKRLLSVTDVANYLGIDRATARDRYGITGAKGIVATELARKLLS